MKKQTSLSKILLIVAGIAVLAGGGVGIAAYIESRSEAAPEDAGQALSIADMEAAEQEKASVMESAQAENTITYNGESYVYNDDLEVLLIIGVDDYEVTDYEETGRSHSQADLLLLAIFDDETKTYTLLQINRDTMTDTMVYDYFGKYEGLMTQQIALAHTYRSGLEDSCEDTVFAVSNLLYGVDISKYFCLTMTSIPIINDSVGGVTVTIEDDFSEIDDTLVMGETITLQGSQAESYVRGRMSVVNDPTNINRMSRQREYLTAILPMLGAEIAADDSFALDLFDQLSPYMVTDCTVDELSEYIEKFSGYTLDKIVTPEGESVKGEEFMEFYIDETDLRAIVIDLFYEKA